MQVVGDGGAEARGERRRPVRGSLLHTRGAARPKTRFCSGGDSESCGFRAFADLPRRGRCHASCMPAAAAPTDRAPCETTSYRVALGSRRIPAPWPAAQAANRVPPCARWCSFPTARAPAAARPPASEDRCDKPNTQSGRAAATTASRSGYSLLRVHCGQDPGASIPRPSTVPKAPEQPDRTRVSRGADSVKGRAGRRAT